MKIEIQPCKDYTNPFNCGIAKGLRKKFIYAMVAPKSYVGLFLWIIPVFGRIPKETNDLAHKSSRYGFTPTIAKINIFH